MRSPAGDLGDVTAALEVGNAVTGADHAAALADVAGVRRGDVADAGDVLGEVEVLGVLLDLDQGVGLVGTLDRGAEESLGMSSPARGQR
jgi:hypothetical protein